MCLEINPSDKWPRKAVLGLGSSLLVIINQVLRITKIAVKIDVKKWAYISLR